MSSTDIEITRDIAVQEAAPKLQRPRMYKVILLNDDYTPMEFVVTVLQNMFAADHSKAVQIMLEVHTKGRGVCGLFTRDIAETKVVMVNDYAQVNEQPLLCVMEPE